MNWYQASEGTDLATGQSGINITIVQSLNFGGSIPVSEQEILDAMRFVVTRMKLVIEPSAATAFAAVMRYSNLFTGRRVGIIASGGNVDLSVLA